MITFTILIIIALILIICTALTLSIGGVAFILVFGDAIIFVLLMAFIIKKLKKK